MQFRVIGWLEAIKGYGKIRLSFGVIPVDTHDVRCRLKTWKLLFVGALLLSYKCAEILVDCYVY